jgi:alginate O-acetyltransferase complex protein AlgI
LTQQGVQQLTQRLDVQETAPPSWPQRLPVPPGLSRLLTLLFVMLAWTLFRAPDMQAALRMYAGQFGLHGLAMGDTLHALLRPGHAVAAVVGVVCVILPAFRPHWETRHAGTRLAAVIALWPIPAFLLSFALIASRGAVPFLYFQF